MAYLDRANLVERDKDKRLDEDAEENRTVVKPREYEHQRGLNGK